MYIGLHVKYPLFLSAFNATWLFSTDFRGEKTEISNLMKIRPVEAELCPWWMDRHTDGGHADVRKIIAFRKILRKATKKFGPCDIARFMRFESTYRYPHLPINTLEMSGLIAEPCCTSDNQVLLTASAFAVS